MERKLKQYRLTIGKPLVITPTFFSPRPILQSPQRWIDLEEFYHKDNANSYVLESNDDGNCFSISFDCSRKSGTNSECSIDIYNLDDGLTDYILDRSGQDLLVKLEAGYNGELRKIIEGTLTDVYDSWSRQNRTLNLVVEDSAVNKRNAYTVRSYGKNTPYSKIVSDLVADMGMKKGVIATPEKYPVTKVPVTYAGNSNDLIHMMAKKYKHVFTINDQHAYITPLNKRVSTVSSYISAESGLIDNASKKRSRRKSKNTANDVTITFKCQMDGTIFPDQSVWVKDNVIDTAVKVSKVRLRGAYPKGSWECLCDGLPVEDLIK